MQGATKKAVEVAVIIALVGAAGFIFHAGGKLSEATFGPKEVKLTVSAKGDE